MPATLRAAPTTSLTAYVNERSTSSLSGRPVIPDLDTAIVVAGICATRWATAWLVVLVSAAAITSMTMKGGTSLRPEACNRRPARSVNVASSMDICYLTPAHAKTGDWCPELALFGSL